MYGTNNASLMSLAIHPAKPPFGASMSKPSPVNNTPPVIRCHPQTAALLGAVPLRTADDVRRFGSACIPVQAQDGSRWLWPIEAQFLKAIGRA